MSGAILTWILYFSALNHVDPLLVRAVVQVESGGQVGKVGLLREQGLMQLRSSSFNETEQQLKEPRHNLEKGIQYLSQLQNSCPFKERYEFVICYNKGVSGAKKVRQPSQDKYYRLVMQEYRKLEKE